jgi:hypothetical protein
VCPFKADHDFILCTLGNKGELSQNLPGGATEIPQLTYTCDRTVKSIISLNYLAK